MLAFHSVRRAFTTTITSILPKNLPDVAYDGVYYQMGLNNWVSIRDTVPDMINYFKDNINWFVDRNHHNPWRMLSVGCGNGSLDLPLLNFITDRFPNIDVHYEGLDPSSTRLLEFQKATVAVMTRPRHHMIFHQSDFEHYMDSINENNRFDLILCARVLNYMNNRLDATFTQLFEKLLQPKSGKILVFQPSPSWLAQMAHIAGMTQQSPARPCNTHDLKLALDRISPNHPSLRYKVIYLEKYTDMSFLDEIRSNDEAKRDKAINLLSFILGKDLRGVETDRVEKVVERILSSVTLATINGNQHTMFQPIGVIVVESCE